jgi:hypothetical protein
MRAIRVQGMKQRSDEHARSFTGELAGREAKAVSSVQSFPGDGLEHAGAIFPDRLAHRDVTV